MPGRVGDIEPAIALVIGDCRWSLEPGLGGRPEQLAFAVHQEEALVLFPRVGFRPSRGSGRPWTRPLDANEKLTTCARIE
ncbi:MAG: hypothetical protein A2X50_16830 [Candidatus Rokubacteria bacterium GWF2_70_14]|nr:MAG: hypothetical protein A2X53_17215 [Candidatus Rokubacteria bacterium GWA2_70_23]OGK90460.1 MAG: hypothetical protein A2X50_16830 [Candidatus Rokubacteria bacterium GWF2_70_14]